MNRVRNYSIIYRRSGKVKQSNAIQNPTEQSRAVDFARILNKQRSLVELSMLLCWRSPKPETKQKVNGYNMYSVCIHLSLYRSPFVYIYIYGKCEFAHVCRLSHILQHQIIIWWAHATLSWNSTREKKEKVNRLWSYAKHEQKKKQPNLQ